MLELYFFNVGHGDSIAIKFPDETWGVIDCNRNKGERIPQVLSFLKKQKINKLNFICITHPHSDHYNGIDMLVEYFEKNIDKFILYGLTANDKERNTSTSLGRAISKFVEINKKNIADKFILAECGKKYKFSGIDLCCLNPTGEILNELRIKQIYNASNVMYNDTSVVFFVNHAGKKILLNADSSLKNWCKIFSNNSDYLSDIIKISHHGSKENNSEKLLSSLIKSGSVSIISTDGGVKYSTIPSNEVIDYIETVCRAEVLKTNDLYKSNNKTLYGISDELKEVVVDATTSDIESVSYDGFIKLTVLDDGRIVKETYSTFNEYFKD